MRVPSARRSCARHSVSPTTANLLAMYGAEYPPEINPASDDVFTTCPSSPASIMRGTNVRMPCKTPQKLTPITHSQSASSRCHVMPAWNTPALLHKRWTAPNRSYVRPASASTWSARCTSVGTTSTSAPAVSTSAADSSRALSSTSAITTRIPSCAACFASARPIPLPAPVTTATRSVKRSIPLRRSAAEHVAVAHRLSPFVEGRQRRFDIVGRPLVVDLEASVDARTRDYVDHAPVHHEDLARHVGGSG